jgi:hypothetical protein
VTAAIVRSHVDGECAMKFEIPFEDAAATSVRHDGSVAPGGVSADPAQPTSHPPHTDGRTLRRRARLRGWKLPITDGPFAESKEL